MAILFGGWLGIASAAEHQANPAVAAAGQTYQPTGNMEGKEVRFGDTSSALYATASTQTSTGSVDSAEDSFTPIGGFAVLTGMMLGEVSPGGVGTGLYSILLFAIITVFIGGLMVGRTPEYLGKKIQSREVKLAALGVLVMPIVVLVLTAIAVSVGAGRAGPLNAGPHGFSEILYDFTSVTNNNGSAFAGISVNTAVLQRHQHGWPAARPLRHHRPGAGPGRSAGGQGKGGGTARARSAPTTRCSSGWWSA